MKLANSIDPCYAQMPLWIVDQDKLNSMLAADNLTAEDKFTIKQVLFPQSKMINYDLDLLFSNQKILKNLIAAGAIKKVHDGLATETYPFKKESIPTEKTARAGNATQGLFSRGS